MKRLLLGLALLAGMCPGAAMENGIVIAVQVKGTVEVVRANESAAAPVANNDALSAGDTVETKAQSSCVLVLPNGSTVAVRERTRLSITLALQERYTDAELVTAGNSKREPSKSSTTLDLLLGEIVVQAKKLLGGSDLSVKTAAGTAKVKGTEFEVGYAENARGEAELQIGTASGHVVFAQPDGLERDVTASQQLKVRAKRDRTGLRLERVNTWRLPAEHRKRIQNDAQVAARESEGGLRRMQAVHEERRKAGAQPQHQQVTPIERQQRGRVIDSPAEKPTTPRINPARKPAADRDPKLKPKPRPTSPRS